MTEAVTIPPGRVGLSSRNSGPNTRKRLNSPRNVGAGVGYDLWGGPSTTAPGPIPSGSAARTSITDQAVIEDVRPLDAGSIVFSNVSSYRPSGDSHATTWRVLAAAGSAMTTTSTRSSPSVARARATDELEVRGKASAASRADPLKTVRSASRRSSIPRALGRLIVVWVRRASTVPARVAEARTSKPPIAPVGSSTRPGPEPNDSTSKLRSAKTPHEQTMMSLPRFTTSDSTVRAASTVAASTTMSAASNAAAASSGLLREFNTAVRLTSGTEPACRASITVCPIAPVPTTHTDIG